MMAKRKYSSSRLQKKKRILFYIKITGIILSCVLFVWFVYFISHHKSHQVTNVVISGQKYISEEEIKNIVLEDMKGSYLFLFSRQSSLFIPRSNIKRDIREAFPSIDSVSVSFGDIHTIEVSVQEFEPRSRWCSENNECFLMNPSGMLFIEEPVIFTESLITFYGLIGEEKIGQTFLSEKQFKDILEFIDGVKEFDLYVQSVSYDNEDGTLDLSLKRKAEIYINQKDDLKVALKNLRTAIEQDAIKGAQLNNIEYIDLRFGKKVFYKLH